MRPYDAILIVTAFLSFLIGAAFMADMLMGPDPDLEDPDDR